MRDRRFWQTVTASDPGYRPGPLAFALVAALGWAAAPLTAGGQETGSMVGRVVDLQSSAPVSTAEVWVPAAQVSVTTNDLGWFIVPSVPLGEYVIEIGRVGYRTETRVVAIGAEAVSLEIKLDRDPVEIPGVEVVQSRRTVTGFDVTRVDLSRLGPASGKAIDLLRRLGAPLFRFNGQPGSVPSVQFRGSTSISTTREPLVIVDGTMTSLSTLQDMPAYDIATIEILKGAAAAAEYGSRGAAGVIVVATKRGAAR